VDRRVRLLRTGTDPLVASERRAVSRAVRSYAPTLPVVFDLDVGHTAPVVPVPLGAPVEVDPGERTVRFPSAGR
jgi:muramoyltetrapeptide carboxypeptidase LdcA involved in peptidoglycan recycling